MCVARLPVCFIALTMALALGGCNQSPTTRNALPHASPPATHHVLPLTPTPTPRSTLDSSPRPVRLLIPAIGLNASVESVGILPNSDLAIPTQDPWEDVGWYDSGPRPGERGSAVIDGHLDRPGGYPAVFWRLRDLHVGDGVMVIDAKGKTFRFQVTSMMFYSPQDAPIQEIFANESASFLNLITCAGDWIPSQHQTTLRLVVYTSLIG